MKRQNCSLSFKSLSEFSSSEDESEKAKPKIDKEELKKYLKETDEESSQEELYSLPKPKSDKRRKTLPSQPSPIIKPKKVISKDPTQNYLAQGDNFKKLQKKAKKLGADSLRYSKRKNYKYMIEYDDKKIHFGSTNTEDYITHKDPVRRDKYLTKAKKISNKDGQLTYQIPSYPNYWSVKLLN